jgi:tripartite-type tricarboxylate transporter receptor subunit TctC
MEPTMIIKGIFLSAILAVVGGAITTVSTHAQAAYPEKLIKMYMPSTAGGQTDVMARLVAQTMQQTLGQSVIIENRPGAGGALGARAAAHAEPDGYSLFFGNTTTLAVIPAVSKSAGYDPVKNFAPVASVSESYAILVVNPSFPAKTVQEFIAYAKANPGKLNYAHAGPGNVTHLIGEMFRAMGGIDFVNVPHKGGAESVSAILGNQVDFVFESAVVLLPLIKEGKLHALAVTSAKRQSEIPEVPTMIESGVSGFAASLFTGVVAPAGTPPAITVKLNGAINESLKTAQMKDILVKLGSEAKISTPQEFATFLAGETRKWSDIASSAGVSID